MNPQIMPQDLDAAPEAWARVRGALLGQLGQDAFQNWIDPLVFVGCDHGVVHLDGADAASSAPGCRATTATPSASSSARTASRSAASSSASPAGRRRAPRRRRPCASPPTPGRRRFRRTSTSPPRRSTGAAPSRTSSSASRTSSPTPPRAGGRRRGRGRAGHLQPALPLRRRRPRQDPPHARHRLGGAAVEPRGARPLPLRRAVHVPLRLGAALQGHARLQGDVPLGRHADGRRRAVHLRQGLDPGGVLPHLQRADRAAEADRHLRRPRAGRDRRPRGAHPLAPAVGPRRRPPPHRLRAPPRHPAGQGRGAAGEEPGRRDRRRRHGVPRPPHQLERPRARRRAQPALRLREPRRARRSTST